MDAKRYKQGTRKKITCPSGLEIVIRKVKALDYLRMGFLPDTLNEMKKNPEKTDPKIIEQTQKMFLMQVVVSQNDFKIVDKPLDQTDENEVSYQEMDDDDVRFIIDEIVKFSSIDQEAKGDPRPFQGESVSDTD